MAGNIIEKATTIRRREDPVTALYLITRGRVQVQFPGGSYLIGAGDVAGICELCYDVHFLSYTAVEDTAVMAHPLTGLETLEDLLQKNTNIAKLFLLSLFRQLGAMMEQCSVTEVNNTELYRMLREDRELYTRLCSEHKVQPHLPAGAEDILTDLAEDSPDEWLDGYYSALRRIYAGANSNILLQESGLSLGVLRKGSLDFRKTYSVQEARYQYCSQILDCYFSASGSDMFDVLTKLYYRLCQEGKDGSELRESIERMLTLPEKYKFPEETGADARIQAFRQKIDSLAGPGKTEDGTDSSDADILQQLQGSLDTILDFAGLDQSTENSFREHVGLYRATADKNSSDDECTRLRKMLTEEFNTLYAEVFERSLSVPSLPAPVRMFLYFGYVDETLAGEEYSVILYRLACYMDTSGQSGVYTFYDWLTAIYRGEKSPSRSELDEDYDDFILQQKKKGNLTAAQIAALENSGIDKVRYELQNLFPSANKVTFGRITTFCPLFTADNVLKDLKASYITPEKIHGALERLKKIDFSAFYRETTNYEGSQEMNREPIHVEYLPDVILMPNVGIKGSMWQEIEGRKRNSSGRMILSVFFMDDLDTAMVRMTGEFRWELCRRIQGGRWNDVSEPSLTSEYFDYMQFYKKNTELSKDTKEKIYTSLQRAKNSFREMFVRDYITWILYEGNGSARLNKVARRILFSYCPFSASLDGIFEQNPMYSELLGRQRTLSRQRIHKLEVLRQKLRNGNIRVPECLEQEIRFTGREV